jgi:hypothetical protein
VPDLTTPTTRAERRAAVAAWRAVPVRQRFAVLRSAKQGMRHPDASAAAAAEEYARVCERPRGPHWWQRPRHRITPWVMAMFAVAMAVYGVLFFRLEGGGSAMGWVCAGLAVIGTLYGLFLWDGMRDRRHLLAVSPPPEPDPTS